MFTPAILPGSAERRNHDFINDVLAGLNRRGIIFRGGRPFNVTWSLDGTVACHFFGERSGRPWVGAVTLRAVLPSGAGDMEISAAAQPEAVVAACAEAVARIARADNNLSGSTQAVREAAAERLAGKP